jgi:hypothetical protein
MFKLLSSLVLALALIITPAYAQRKLPPKEGGAISNLVSKLEKVTLADLQYASALAKAHQDTIASNCWDAWAAFIQLDQQTMAGSDGKPIPLPEPHVITTIQQTFNIANALQPTSPMSIACAALGNKVKMDVLQLIMAAATGALIGGIPLP